MSEIPESVIDQESEQIPFSEFLEDIPPSQMCYISDLAKPIREQSGKAFIHRLFKPELQLYCTNDACNGIRFFRCTDIHDLPIHSDRYELFYLSYRCANCNKTTKTFSLMARVDSETNLGCCYKLGEYPPYGPPTPSRLIKLIGPDREIFLKGRNCENQGLGIGAFVYYRRVVENQKNRILDEIIKVSRKLNIKDEIIDILEVAKVETQFSKALASVKDAVPETLLISGQNPLTLLHSALSEGLHDLTDEECLDIASSVRVVLAELSERLAQALKDEAELNLALSKLMKMKNKGQRR